MSVKFLVMIIRSPISGCSGIQATVSSPRSQLHANFYPAQESEGQKTIIGRGEYILVLRHRWHVQGSFLLNPSGHCESAYPCRCPNRYKAACQILVYLKDHVALPTEPHSQEARGQFPFRYHQRVQEPHFSSVGPVLIRVSSFTLVVVTIVL